MTLPLTDLKFSDINTELTRTGTATFNLDDPDGRNLASVGVSSPAQTVANTPISASQFVGHAYAKIAYNDTRTNVILSTSSYSPGKTFGVVTIGSSGVIGASATGNYGMTIQGSAGDKIVLQNSGAIVGAGGNGGANQYGNGLGGGPALRVQGVTTILYNVGTIGGGGGGGGGGVSFEDGQRPRERSAGEGGGGGAGYIVGAGGILTSGSTRSYRPQAGQAGSLYTGGQSGAGNTSQGGKGGNLGQGGQNAPGGGLGGSAGAAISGVGFVQVAQAGTISGTTV